MAIKPDPAFERFNFCSLLGIASELELMQGLESHSSILTFIFVQSEWSPPPSPFSLSAIAVTSACLIPNISLWGEKLIRKFKAVRSYLKIIPLSATPRRNFCANYHWRPAYAVATVN